MENSERIVAQVISPAKDAHLRNGRGFSLPEIKKAEKSVSLLRELNIQVDFHRKSLYDTNVKLLKSLKPASKKRKKKEPFVLKEKKRTEFKPETERPKAKKPTKKPTPKPVSKPATVKKEKAKEKSVKKQKEKLDKIPLTELSGLGPTTAKKFQELGIDSVEVLIKEVPEELAPLVKGCSVDRIKKWIEEGSQLLTK